MESTSIKYRGLTLGKVLRNLVLALVVSISFSGLMPVIASADQDYHNLPNGYVTNVQPMTLPSDLQPIATGKLITYVSTDVFNNKFLVTGAVITPNNEPRNANIVAWGHGTTGVDSHCAPSTNLSVFWPEAIVATKSYLEHGWVVAATDYQGLGGTGQHEYVVGNTEARAMIDSVRAARRLDDNLSNRWVASGHSQGGQGALFAGEIAGTYGNGLHLLGAVGLAPLSNVEALANNVAGTPEQFYLPFVFYGLQAYDPTVNITNLMGQEANNLYPVVHTGCFNEVMNAYQNLTADQMLNGGQIPQNIVNEIAGYADPAQRPSTVPVFLAEGTADFLLPATQALFQEECANGVNTEVQYYDGIDHDNVPIASVNDAANYITALFSGQTPPSEC